MPGAHDHHSMTEDRNISFRGFDPCEEVRIMPNHVHAVIVPRIGYDLLTLLQGIKGTSVNRCNKLLGRKSDFWMDESYDHIIATRTNWRPFLVTLGTTLEKPVSSPRNTRLSFEMCWQRDVNVCASLAVDKIVCITH